MPFHLPLFVTPRRDARKQDNSKRPRGRGRIFSIRISIAAQHRPGYNSVDFHFTPGQQMSRGTAVFDKSSNHISSPGETSPLRHRLRVFNVSRRVSVIFLPYFFPSLRFSRARSNAHARNETATKERSGPRSAFNEREDVVEG